MRNQKYFKIVIFIIVLFWVPSTSVAEEITVFKLKTEDGRLTPVSGRPYMIASFSPQGEPHSGIFADFRSTKFDLTEVEDKYKKDVGVAVQQTASREFTHTVIVNATGLKSFFIDKDYIVYPPGVSKVKKGGAFIRLIFHAKSKNKEPINSWEITVKHGDETITGKLSSSGVFDVSNVTLNPIICALKDPVSKMQYEYTAYPAVRGAVKGMVEYLVWNINK